MKKYTFLSLFITFQLFILAQTKPFVVSGDVFGCRVFIKNNGQFNNIKTNGETIKYGYVNGNEKIYFTLKGLTYLLQKTYPLTEHQHEEMEHGKKIEVKPPENFYVYMTWENANSNIEIEETEKQAWYHSFGDKEFKSECYKKITYKNVYNNIDIEYVFPNDKTDGIKYNIILHEGANSNDIRIKYTGDVNGINLKKGNVIIKTLVEDIIEHSPISQQNNHFVETEFIKYNNVIGFNFPNGYNTKTPITIDPWVTTLNLISNNYGYDVDYDYAGNYFVYGGGGPFLVSKYSPIGNLLWTFNGTVPSQGWSSDGTFPAQKFVGNFVVNKSTGKAYIGDGVNLLGVRSVRLDLNGIYDNLISSADTTLNELWDMGFNTTTDSIYIFGGSTSGSVSAAYINQTTGISSPQNFSGLSSFEQDIVSHAIDPAGNLYLVFASAIGTPSINNKIMLTNSLLNGNIWLQPTGFNTFKEAANKNYVGGITKPCIPGGSSSFCGYSNGFNALASNNNFLYYYDGHNISAYSKLTGTILGFISVPSYTLLQQGGIAVDECDNLYVGGNGSILCYYFNGSSFIPNGIIPTNTPTTYKYVYDIKLDTKSKLLFVSGSGFGGIYPAINSVKASFNANPLSGVVPLTVNFTNTSTGSINYNWNFGDGQTSVNTNPNNIFTTNGTYTVSLVALNGSCSDTSTAIVIVEGGVLLEIPNVFTPNKDGINDVFSIKASGVKDVTLQIYNRWGLLLNESKGSNTSWDGRTTSGIEATDGTYFYIVKGIGFDDKEIEKHGFVNLFR